MDLETEARYYFKCLFNSEISDELVFFYLKAHERFGPDLFLDHKIASTIVEQCLDPVAIEFSSKGKYKVIKNKLLLLCYLAELDGQYAEFFVNYRDQTVSAFFKLALEVLKTPYLFIKGKYSIQKYGLF